jgi:hypothetical protein
LGNIQNSRRGAVGQEQPYFSRLARWQGHAREMGGAKPI